MNDTMNEGYNSNVRSLVEMFTDGTVGESVSSNRLITVENDAGNVSLIGYGEKVIAEYDEAEGVVTAYYGHKRGAGETVSKWLNYVTEEASERRSLIISDRSPWFATPNAESAQYIGEYIDHTTSLSPVERRANRTVVESLKWLDKFL